MFLEVEKTFVCLEKRLNTEKNFPSKKKRLCLNSWRSGLTLFFYSNIFCGSPPPPKSKNSKDLFSVDKKSGQIPGGECCFKKKECLVFFFHKIWSNFGRENPILISVVCFISVSMTNKYCLTNWCFFSNSKCWFGVKSKTYFKNRTFYFTWYGKK